MLTRRAVRRMTGDALVVWLDPGTIHHYVGQNITSRSRTDNLKRRASSTLKLKRRAKWLARLLATDPRFILPADRYKEPVPVEELKKYRKVKDLVDSADDFVRSDWYRQLQAAIQREGVVWHKDISLRSTADLDAFFRDYVLDLVDSMRRDGYVTDRTTSIGNVTIGDQGQFHKANAGDHRFFVARIVGVRTMPFRVIGVHEQWAAQAGIHDGPEGVPRLVEAVAEVARRQP